MKTCSICISSDQILVKVVEDRHGLRLPLLQVSLQHSPDRLEEGHRDVCHGVDLPSVQVEIFICKAVLPQSIHIYLNSNSVIYATIL